MRTFADVLSGSFTRPDDTTAYASGDLVANSTTNTSVVAVSLTGAALNPGAKGRIERVRLSKSTVSTTNAQFRVHLFTAAPVTVTNGDNAAFSVSGVAGYIGSFDVTMGQAFTDGAFGVGVVSSAAGTSAIYVAATGSSTLYALVEARAAYTPVAQEVFTVKAEVSLY